jgi:hypothetical protein
VKGKSTGQKESINEIKILNSSIKNTVVQLRNSLYKSIDQLVSGLIKSLKGLEGIQYYEDSRRDQIVFSLPLPQPSQMIEYPDEYSMKDLLNDADTLSDCSQQESFLKLCNVLQEHHSRQNTPHLLKWYKDSKTKARICKRLMFGCEGGEVQLSLSLMKNQYVCSHYNSADLPMLSDFESIKNLMNVVNKSFVTIRKPLRLYNFNVHIRDTILLAPGGMGTLDKIGSMYPTEYSKLNFEVDKSRMSEFLKRDKQAFEQYALRDALIVLKHAVAMENFNQGVKQIGWL